MGSVAPTGLASLQTSASVCTPRHQLQSLKCVCYNKDRAVSPARLVRGLLEVCVTTKIVCAFSRKTPELHRFRQRSDVGRVFYRCGV